MVDALRLTLRGLRLDLRGGTGSEASTIVRSADNLSDWVKPTTRDDTRATGGYGSDEMQRALVKAAV